MAQDLILTPWGLDGDIARAKPNTNLAPDVIPFAAPNSTQQQQAPTTLTPQMMDSILAGARKKAASSVADPYASKFQDSSLSERYEGRNVFYGDYKLDPKILDARYSKQQSWWEQSANNLKVGAANGGAMFASGMLALPDILRNLANGTPITESPLEKSLYNWRKGVANNNVTFQNEQDQKTDAWNTIKNTLLPSFISGSTTGWGSVFENMMYGVGAGAALVVQEALVSAIAPGVGNSAVLAGNVAKILNNVNNIRKYSQLADRIIDTSATLGNIAKQLNNGNRLIDGAKWGYRASIGSYGEAAFEAEEAEHTLKQNLTEKFKATNGFAPTGADLDNINKLAAEGKSTRFWGNMTLLMGTNSFQLKRLFRGIDLAKESAENLAKQGLKIELNEAGEAVAKKAFELKSDWWNKGFASKLKPIVETIVSRTPKDFLLESGSEGFEEFSQDWISKGVNNYYSWKLDHRGQAGIDQAVKSMKEAFGESWNTEGLKAFLSGAVAGVAQQAIFSVPGAKRNWELGKANKTELENTLKSYNNFDVNDFFKFSNVNSVRGSVTSKAESLNAASVIDDVAQIAEDTNDKKLYKDLEAINFFNLSEPYVEKGHSQILKDQFAFSLENMSDEQVQDIFGNPAITKTGAIAEFNNKVEDINASYSKIKTAFRNPYSVGHPNYEIFESKFIPQLAYLDYRTKDLMDRRDDIQSTLGEYYNEFKYFAEIKDLDKGEGYIKEELKRFNDVAEYLKTLAHEGFVEEEFNKNKHLINTYTQALKEIEDFRKDSTFDNYNKFLDTYHEGFVSKLERNERGFFNKDEVMSKLTDFGRITSDLQGVEDMLKIYLGTNGEQAFMSEYRFDAVRELRKRELYNLNQKLIDHAPKLREEFPQLSDAQIEDILLNSSNTEQATTKARELAAKEDEKNAKIDELKTKIRDKFIAEGRGDVVEDFLDTADFSDEKAVMQKADDYIKLINNKEFGDFKQTKHDAFLASIAKLSPNFKGTGYLQEEENQNVYDALGRESKIKYHEALIKYYQELKTFKNLPKEYIRKQNIFIQEQQDAIKALPAEDDVYTEQVGEYNIVKENGKYVLSLGDNVIDTFPTLKDAKEYIANIESKKEALTDVKADNIANLENKFENGYYDPNTYDKNGNKIVSKEQAIKNRSIKAPLYNSIAANKSEDQIAELITQNIVIDKYEVEDNAKIIGKLDEPVLRSGTTDALVVSYMDGENKIPLNTYKNYKKGLGFMPENILRPLLEKAFPNSTGLSLEAAIAFIGNNSYYEFLQKSLVDPRLFKILQDNNLIGFKGSLQDQIALIEEKQGIWDKLDSGNLEDIKRDVIFQREFTGIQYKDLGTHNITDVVYPFALLKDKDGKRYNRYVFFHVKETFKPGQTPNVEFVGLSPDFHEEALEKITASFTKRFKDGETDLYNGYYTLLSDSSGNGATYKLKARELSPVDVLYSIQNGDYSGVRIESNNPRFDVSLTVKEGDLRVNIGDTSDESVLSFDYEIKTEKDVENLIKQIYKELKKPQNWGGITGKKSIDTKKLIFHMASKSSRTPTSVEEILENRQILGINPVNYRVNKLVPKLRNVTSPQVTLLAPPVPKPVVKRQAPSVSTTKTSDIAKRFLGDQMYKFPNTITFDQIDELVESFPNLQISKDKIREIVVLASYLRSVKEDVPVYLNDVSKINIKNLEKLATLPINKISNALNNADVINLVTTSIPYKTNISNSTIENRVQALIKNCFR